MIYEKCWRTLTRRAVDVHVHVVLKHFVSHHERSCSKVTNDVGRHHGLAVQTFNPNVVFTKLFTSNGKRDSFQAVADSGGDNGL